MKAFSQVLETTTMSGCEGQVRFGLGRKGLSREKDQEVSAGMLRLHLQQSPSSWTEPRS